jgi:glycine/D-amino acid oxidase-like deaminating enzyme
VILLVACDHMAEKNIIVVGGGIIGAAYAFELARRGAKVTLLDSASAVGGVATPNSWAWINASWGNAEAYFRLRKASMEMWRSLDGQVPGLVVQRIGGLLWDLPEADLRAFVKERTGQGYDVRLVDHAEIQRIEPNLLTVPSLAAHAPGEAAIEPVHAVEQLLKAAQALGVSVITGHRVKRLHEEMCRITGIVTDEGVIMADDVVLAAGAASVDLLEPLDYRLPIESIEGLLVYSTPAPELLHGLLLAPELHVRQRTDGTLIAGTDVGGADPGSNAEGTARAVFAKVQKMLKGGEKFNYGGYTIGHRPTPKDGVSIIGRIAGLEGLYVTVTHSGITLAPALSALGVEEMLTGTRHPLLAPFGPERFADA